MLNVPPHTSTIPAVDIDMQVDEPIEKASVPASTDEIPAISQIAKETWKAIFPLSKVKEIMKLDPSAQQLTPEAIYATTIAAQLFLELLVMEAHQFTLKDSRKTITYADVSKAVEDVHEFEFLMDIVPRPISVKEAKRKAEALKASLVNDE